MTALRHHRNDRGFTLVELTVTLGITAFIAFAASTLQRDMLSVDRILRGNLTTQSEVRKAFKDFTAAARITTSAENGSYPLATTSATTFTFYADVDGNGVTERYRYFLNGTNLMKGVIVPTGSPLAYDTGNEVLSTVVGNMANGSTAIFEYFPSTYDGTSAALTQPVTATSVRLVKITVVVDANGTRPPNAQTFTTQVMLRTLKDNL